MTVKSVTDYCAEVIRALQQKWDVKPKDPSVPSVDQVSFYIAPSVWFWLAEPDKLPSSFLSIRNFQAYKLPAIVVTAQGSLRDVVFGGMAWDITMRIYVMLHGIPNPTTVSQAAKICEHIINILITTVNRPGYWSTITPTMYRPIELPSAEGGMLGITFSVIECKVEGLPAPLFGS